MSHEGSVSRFIRLVRTIKGMSLDSAVIHVALRYHDLAADVMDRIGSWPATEPELRALQRHWPATQVSARLMRSE